MVKRSEASSEAYPVALLRIAVGLKLRPQATLDEIVENTTRTMRLSRRKFRSYLAKHMALLAQAATDVETPAAKRSGITQVGPLRSTASSAGDRHHAQGRPKSEAAVATLSAPDDRGCGTRFTARAPRCNKLRGWDAIIAGSALRYRLSRSRC